MPPFRRSLLAALPAVLALLLLLLSLSPHSTTRNLLHAVGGGESAAYYTEAAHTSLAPRLRLAVVALALLGSVLWVFQRRLSQLVAVFRAAVRDELRLLRDRWRTSHYGPGAVLALVGLTALALALRLPHLNQPIRYDEAFTYLSFVSRPVLVIVSKYDYPNNHVFHSLCAHACLWLGSEPWVFRLPALVAGVLIVPAGYLAARGLYNEPTAWLSAALLACSSPLIEFSTNARGYTLLCLFVLLHISLSCAVLRRRLVLGWTLWIVVAALGFWTTPTMLYPFGGVVVWMALSSLLGPAAAAYGRMFVVWLATACVLAGLLTTLLYLPIFVTFGPGAVFGNRFVAPLSWSKWMAELPSSLAITWELWQRDLPTALVIVLCGGFAASLFLAARVGRRGVSIALVLALCSAALVVAQRVAPYARIWLFALPVYLIAASAGLVAVARAWKAPGVRTAWIGVAVAAGMWMLVQLITSNSVRDSRETGTLRDASEVAALLRERLEEGDLIVSTCPSDAPLMYHFERQGLPMRYFLMRSELTTFDGQRLLVVVNKRHEQTFAELAERFRLRQVVDVEAARLVGDFETAAVYEIGMPSAPGRAQAN
jgi:hypothetical protein